VTSKPVKLLFVCSRNRWRSPTAEAVLNQVDGVTAISAGINHDAETPLSGDLIEWADRIYVMETGALTFEGPITIADGAPIGHTLYVMKTPQDGGGAQWIAVRYETDSGAEAPDAPTTDPLHRISADADVRQHLAALFVPGSTLLVTQDPAHPGTRSEPGFVVATHPTV